MYFILMQDFTNWDKICISPAIYPSNKAMVRRASKASCMPASLFSLAKTNVIGLNLFLYIPEIVQWTSEPAIIVFLNETHQLIALG